MSVLIIAACWSERAYVLYVPRSRVRGLVSLALRFPFVYVKTYTNSNLDDDKTKPRTRDRGTYSSTRSMVYKHPSKRTNLT